MVVKSNPIDPMQLDLAYLALFLGQRVNELVVTRLQKSGAAGVRESHGYVIQHLIDAERTISELARRMGVTQQAASKSVAALLRLGIVEAAPSGDRRTKAIRLSRRGWESVKQARKARAEIDARLEKTLGKKAYARVKERLLDCLNELGGVERVKARRVREPN
jgi:DNA-binding MarR family transcriptional regulator